jgi:hypothetical protein
MDVFSWLLWLLGWLISLIWSLVWLLLGGWVSTLAQLLALLAIVAIYRHGWRRAPIEVWSQLSRFARFALAWIKGTEPLMRNSPPTRAQDNVRLVRVKEFGDVNLSTALSVLVLAGLCALVAAF